MNKRSNTGPPTIWCIAQMICAFGERQFHRGASSHKKSASVDRRTFFSIGSSVANTPIQAVIKTGRLPAATAAATPASASGHDDRRSDVDRGHPASPPTATSATDDDTPTSTATSATAPLGLRRRCGRSQEQTRRSYNADHVDKHQRRPSEAAGKDIVASSHLASPGSLPNQDKISACLIRTGHENRGLAKKNSNVLVECYGEAPGRSSNTVFRRQDEQDEQESKHQIAALGYCAVRDFPLGERTPQL